MCTYGGAVTLKFGVVPCPRKATGNSLPVYGAAVFAVAVAGADEFSGVPVFNGVFQPKGGGFGKVAGLKPPIKSFPRVAAALGAVAVGVVNGV